MFVHPDTMTSKEILDTIEELAKHLHQADMLNLADIVVRRMAVVRADAVGVFVGTCPDHPDNLRAVSICPGYTDPGEAMRKAAALLGGVTSCVGHMTAETAARTNLPLGVMQMQVFAMSNLATVNRIGG